MRFPADLNLSLYNLVSKKYRLCTCTKLHNVVFENIAPLEFVKPVILIIINDDDDATADDEGSNNKNHNDNNVFYIHLWTAENFVSFCPLTIKVF